MRGVYGYTKHTGFYAVNIRPGYPPAYSNITPIKPLHHSLPRGIFIVEGRGWQDEIRRITHA